ncbi:MAG TPA: hypothetical protein VK826_01305 [Bacteroidia bacterium]|nr:hypothetical protein [Bacteroidia bacterium]
MRKLLILFFCVWTIHATANPGKRDTTFIKRPYYLGLTAGYTHFLHVLDNNSPSDIAYMPGWVRNQVFYSGISPGLTFAFPFSKKMECEVAMQWSTYFDKRNEITDLVTDTAPFPHIVSYNSVRVWKASHTWELRTAFTYEFLRKNTVALQAGAGGWLAVQDVGYGSGQVGLEGLVKCYVAPAHFPTMQFALACGITHVDMYASLRVSVMLQGTRTYRVKPDKYYVRTYEEGE